MVVNHHPPNAWCVHRAEGATQIDGKKDSSFAYRWTFLQIKRLHLLCICFDQSIIWHRRLHNRGLMSICGLMHLGMWCGCSIFGHLDPFSLECCAVFVHLLCDFWLCHRTISNLLSPSSVHLVSNELYLEVIIVNFSVCVWEWCVCVLVDWVPPMVV